MIRTAVAIYGILILFAALLAYSATREADGKLGEWFVGSAVIAVMFLAKAVRFHVVGRWELPVAAGLLFVAASCVGMIIQPEVEEMAGMMLLFIPATTVGIALINLVLWFGLDWRRRGRSVRNDIPRVRSR